MPRRVCPSPAAPLPRSRILGGIRCVTFVQAKGIHFSVVSSVRLRRCTVGGMTVDRVGVDGEATIMICLPSSLVTRWGGFVSTFN